MGDSVAKQLWAELMRQGRRPDEPEWRSAKDRFSEGVLVQGTVSGVVPFGLFVDLPGTAVQGVVLAPGFTDPAKFSRRAESYPVTSSVILKHPGTLHRYPRPCTLGCMSRCVVGVQCSTETTIGR